MPDFTTNSCFSLLIQSYENFSSQYFKELKSSENGKPFKKYLLAFSNGTIIYFVSFLILTVLIPFASTDNLTSIDTSIDTFFNTLKTFIHDNLVFIAVFIVPFIILISLLLKDGNLKSIRFYYHLFFYGTWCLFLTSAIYFFSNLFFISTEENALIENSIPSIGLILILLIFIALVTTHGMLESKSYKVAPYQLTQRKEYLKKFQQFLNDTELYPANTPKQIDSLIEKLQQNPNFFQDFFSSFKSFFKFLKYILISILSLPFLVKNLDFQSILDLEIFKIEQFKKTGIIYALTFVLILPTLLITSFILYYTVKKIMNLYNNRTSSFQRDLRDLKNYILSQEASPTPSPDNLSQQPEEAPATASLPEESQELEEPQQSPALAH